MVKKQTRKQNKTYIVVRVLSKVGEDAVKTSRKARFGLELEGIII